MSCFQRSMTVCFFAQNFWGRGNVKKNRELIGIINEQRAKMPDTPDEEAEGQIDDAVREQTGCESCGEKDGEMVHQGAFYCVGIWPLCGAYWWRPQRRYLCQKHATRQYILQCLATALGGYWGIPGIVVAPIRVCANMLAIKKTFPKTSTGALAVGFIIGMAPLIAIACWITIAVAD